MVYCTCWRTDLDFGCFGGNRLTLCWLVVCYKSESEDSLWSENGFLIGFLNPLREPGCSLNKINYYNTLTRFLLLLTTVNFSAPIWAVRWVIFRLFTYSFVCVNLNFNCFIFYYTKIIFFLKSIIHYIYFLINGLTELELISRKLIRYFFYFV